MVDKKPVGRPIGPTNPDKLHADELTRWIKVNKRIRGLIETQLTYLENRLKDNSINLEGVLEIMSGLSSLLTTSSRTIESGLKALDKPHAANDTEDMESMLESFHGGKGG